MNQMNEHFKPGGDLGMGAPNSYFKPGGDLGMDAPNSYFKQPGDLGMGAQNSYFQSDRKDENIEAEASNDFVSWDDEDELIEAGSMIVNQKRYEEIVAAGNEILELQVLGPDLISIRYKKIGRGRR